MARYLLKRVFTIIISIVVISTATFLLIQAAPGSPFASEQEMPAEIEEMLNEEYGLNDPLYVQYFEYISSIVTWDFGYSLRYQGQEVNEIINRSFPASLILGLEAIFLALAIGTILGVIAALRKNKMPDYIAMFIAVIGISVPSFILATFLQYIFALQLNLLPIARFDSFAHTVLPAIALAAMPSAFVARLMRSNMIEVMNQDYIKTAKAKGMSEWVVVYRHLIRNAILPVVSFLGPLVVSIVTGSFVVESIFGIPGLGYEYLLSITNRDYTTIMGITVFISILLLFSILLVDLIYSLIDPRIKVDGKE